MSKLEPSPESSDQLDKLLRKFYRSELPAPWPQPPQVDQPAAQPPRWTLWNGRAALAASILLLLVGHFLLSGAWRPFHSEKALRGPRDVASKPSPRAIPVVEKEGAGKSAR